MKVYLFLISIVFYKVSFACDICGGSISVNNMSGLMPMFNKNLIGMRSSYQAFKHPPTIANKTGEKQVLKDVYWSEEIWMRYYLHSKIQAFVNIPFRKNIRELVEHSQKIYGVGDMSFQINYAIYNNVDSGFRDLKLMWWLGGGIKLPNGKYQQRSVDKTMYPIGFQVGTGAYSFLLNSLVSIRKNKIGLNWNSNISLNSTNELDYKMGNVFQTSLQAFYWCTIKANTKLLPQLGFHVLHLQKDINYNVIKKQSGGDRVVTSISIDAYINQWMISANIQKPLIERIGESVPTTLSSYQLNLGYFF